MKLKKVFFIISSIQVGGAENVVFMLASSIAKKPEHTYDICIHELYKTKSKYSDSVRRTLQNSGINCRTLGFGGKYFSTFFSPWVLFYYIMKEKPTVIHSHTDWPDLVLSLAIRITGTGKFDVVRTVHNTVLWPTHHKLGYVAERKFVEDYIIAVSKAAMDSYLNLRAKYQLHPSGTREVIYNGCNLPVGKKSFFNKDTSRINVAFCGRLELQKGTDLFINLVKSLPEQILRFYHFHVVGDGSFRPEVEHLVSEFPENVTYYGEVPGLAEKLTDLDFLIMPSKFEGLPLMSIEAGLSGIPVIAAPVQGLDETLPPEWPLTARNSDVESFTVILKWILEHPDLRTELQRKIYENSRKTFSVSQMTEKYLNVYDNLSHNSG